MTATYQENPTGIFVTDPDASQATGAMNSGIGLLGPSTAQRIGGAEYAIAPGAGEVPVEPVEHVLAVTTALLVATFTVTPKGAGSLDYGDGTAPFAWTAVTTTKAYTYTAAGTFDAVFTPTDPANTGSTVSVVVAEA